MRVKFLAATALACVPLAGALAAGPAPRARPATRPEPHPWTMLPHPALRPGLHIAGDLSPELLASGTLLPGLRLSGTLIGAAPGGPFGAPVGPMPAPGAWCGRLRMPPAGFTRVSQGFSAVHSGIDLVADWGTPVRAAAAGTVAFQGEDGGYGMMVDIRHADGVVTRYAHLSAFASGQTVGSTVPAGQEIGRVGATGNAHGAHVHFEVRLGGRAVDPAPYLALAPCHGTAPSETIEEARAPESGRHGAGRRVVARR